LKKIIAALVAVFLCAQPALATNRTTAYYGLQFPSSWVNQNNRFIRLGLGQFIYDALGSTTGVYSNLSISGAGGLYIAVGPTTANTMGSVYQFLQDDSSPLGGIIGTGGPTALPADPTQIMVQGTLQANTASIGPLAAPGTGGQSINYLIECQVNTVDTTSQTVNTVTPAGAVSSTTANRDRVDQVVCQSKAGSAATSGSQLTPSTDVGYIGVGYVTVANGQSSISGGNVTALPAFAGFSRSGGAGGFAVITGTNTFNGVNTFTAGPNQVPFTVSAASPQNVDLFDVYNNGSTTKYFWVDSAGVSHFNTAVTGTAGGLFGGLASAGANQVFIGSGGGNTSFRSGTGGYVFQDATGVTNWATIGSTNTSLIGSLTMAGTLTIGGALTGATTGTFSSGISSTALTLTGGSTSPAIQQDAGANTGVNFTLPAAAPSFGYRFFANGTGTQLAQINTTGFTSPGYIAAGPSLPSIVVGDISGSRSTTTGALQLGGATSQATLDWNVIKAGAASLSTPFSLTNAFATTTAINFAGDITNAGQTPTTPWIANDAGTVKGFNFNVPTASTFGFRFLTNNATVVAQIDASGNETATTFNVSSRREWKKNITEVNDAISTIMEPGMRVFEWCYNGKGRTINEQCKIGEHKHIGPMANQAPEIIAGHKHDHIDQGGLTGLTLASVQQLVDEVHALRARVQFLENERQGVSQ